MVIIHDDGVEYKDEKECCDDQEEDRNVDNTAPRERLGLPQLQAQDVVVVVVRVLHSNWRVDVWHHLIVHFGAWVLGIAVA